MIPDISFCNKRFASVMSEVAFAEIVSEDISASDPEFKNVSDLFSVLVFLHRMEMVLRNNFGKTANVSEPTNISESDLELLRNWAQHAGDLSQRWLVNTLMMDDEGTPHQQLSRLISLSGPITETMPHCGINDYHCDADSFQHFVDVNHLNCFQYDVLEGGEVEISESSVQGIENGLTFIFMTGQRFLATKYWDGLVIPGYRNTFHTSAGSDGVRVQIQAPRIAGFPDLGGVDVSSGMSTTLGIEAREFINLPHPYSNCTNHNSEADLLVAAIKADTGVTIEVGHGVQASKYSLVQCRATCLLRHMWEQCGCVQYSDGLPFFNSSLLCGRVKMDLLKNSMHCHELEQMTKPECKNTLKKLMDEIQCVEAVHRSNDHEHNLECNCPPPCQTIEYELSYGTAHWPSPGPELDAAFSAIIEKIILPYFKNMNHSLAPEAVEYYSNFSNREEIMEDFARVIIYIKSMTLQRISQVPAYPFLTLLSDTGNHSVFLALSLFSDSGTWDPSNVTEMTHHQRHSIISDTCNEFRACQNDFLFAKSWANMSLLRVNLFKLLDASLEQDIVRVREEKSASVWASRCASHCFQSRTFLISFVKFLLFPLQVDSLDCGSAFPSSLCARSWPFSPSY